MGESTADEPLGRNGPTDSSRVVLAEDSPVPAGPATVPMGSRSAAGPDRIVLRFPPGCALLTALFPMVFTSVLMVVNILTGFWQPEVGFVLLALGLIVAWIWYRKGLLPRTTFDKEASLLLLGWRGKRGTRPLSSVIGIQIMLTRKQFPGTDGSIPPVTLYQLNLIMDDPAERRLNVLTCDLWTARQNAKQVADFLGIPVLDRAGPPTETLGNDGTSTPVDSPIEFATVPSPTLMEPGPDLLLIRPRRFAPLFGVQWMALVAISAPLAIMFAQGAGGPLPGGADWLMVAFVGMAICTALIVLSGLLRTVGRWARFDREQGVMTLGRQGKRASRPLATVKAVEIAEISGIEQLQLNLVPADAQLPRLNLMAEGDAALVRRSAERLAFFLGVPLHGVKQSLYDVVQRGAEHEAVNPLELLDRTAMKAGKASIYGPACLVPKGEGELLLRARSRFRWYQLIPTLLTLCAEFALVWFAWFGAGAGQAGLGWTALIVLIGGLPSIARCLQTAVQVPRPFRSAIRCSDAGVSRDQREVPAGPSAGNTAHPWRADPKSRLILAKSRMRQLSDESGDRRSL